VSLTPAARTGKVYRIDEGELMYFSPRTPAVLRKVADWLHPAVAQAKPS
jgi:iron complex transport system substrate-binding protein